MNTNKFLDFISNKGFITFSGMIILFLCVLTVISFGFYALVTGKSLENVSMIVTSLLSISTGLLGYWWGTSVGSKDKDRVITELTKSQDGTTTN